MAAMESIAVLVAQVPQQEGGRATQLLVDAAVRVVSKLDLDPIAKQLGQGTQTSSWIGFLLFCAPPPMLLHMAAAQKWPKASRPSSSWPNQANDSTVGPRVRTQLDFECPGWDETRIVHL